MELPKPEKFEERPPVSDMQEALRLVAGRYSPGTEPNVEAYIAEHEDTGPYIHVYKLQGLFEETVWERNYRLHPATFASLREQDLIHKGTPWTWSVSQKGVQHLNPSEL